MKCVNCGTQVSENDVFCQNCGKKIERESTSIIENKNEDIVKEEEKVSDKPNQQKKGSSLGILLLVILAAVIYFMFPKTYSMEANELYKELFVEENTKYQKGTLEVHGYLLLTNDPEVFCLASNYVEVGSQLLGVDAIDFTWENYDNTLGSGSELTVKGKLADDGTTLIAEEIVIHKAVDPLLKVDSIDELLGNADYYLGKIIEVPARLTITNMNGSYISDDYMVNVAWLYGISNQELADVYLEGSWCVVKGKLILDGSNYAIEVKDVFQNEFTKEQNEISFYNSEHSVDMVFENPDKYIGKEFYLYGPVEFILDETGSYYTYALTNYYEHMYGYDKFIEIDGNFYEDAGYITAYGMLVQVGNKYVFNIYSYWY